MEHTDRRTGQQKRVDLLGLLPLDLGATSSPHMTGGHGQHTSDTARLISIEEFGLPYRSEVHRTDDLARFQREHSLLPGRARCASHWDAPKDARQACNGRLCVSCGPRMARQWRKPVIEGARARNMILTFTGTIQKVPGRSLEDQVDQLEHVRKLFSGSNWTGRNFAGTAWFLEVKVDNSGNWHPHLNMVFAPRTDLNHDEAVVRAQRVLDRWAEKADLGGARSVITQNAEDLVLRGRRAMTKTMGYLSKAPCWDMPSEKRHVTSWTYAELMNHALAGHMLGVSDGLWAMDRMHDIERATTRSPDRRPRWCDRSGVFTAGKA
jgi:hypothetical protein